MEITWTEDGIERSILITPKSQAIKVIPSKCASTGKRDFAQVWIKNEESGSHSMVSDSRRLSVTGWMHNGAKIKKETFRIS